MRTRVIAALVIFLGSVTVGGSAQARSYSEWAPAQPIEDGGNSSELNTPYLDGCPIQAPDGLSIYLASNRPRFAGDTRTDLDIWVAERSSTDEPFGAPVNLGAPVNSTADDFCPTPLRGKGLLFVSRRITAASCGLGDIYLTRRNPRHGWSEPTHLPCAPLGPNSGLDEQGPSYVDGDVPALYFSRSSMTVPGDIFVSESVGDDAFGPAQPVTRLNDAGANDIQPNVRKDGRELVFSSTRTGGFGGPDIWMATRPSVHAPWSPPTNLGSGVNTGYGESRPFLSSDAHQLLFGRGGPLGTGEGGTGAPDIYVTTRTKNP